MSIRKLPDGTIEADTGEELAEYERLTGRVSVKLVTPPVLPTDCVLLTVTREPDPTGAMVEEPCNVVFERKPTTKEQSFEDFTQIRSATVPELGPEPHTIVEDEKGTIHLVDRDGVYRASFTRAMLEEFLKLGDVELWDNVKLLNTFKKTPST